MHADVVYKLTTTARRGPMRWQPIVCVARTGNPGSRQLSVSNARVVCKPHVVNVEFGIHSSYIASVTADNTTRPLPPSRVTSHRLPRGDSPRPIPPNGPRLPPETT